MSKHERMARIEGINLETGAFDMTLATEGEASDGDILSIKGGQIPERMPMLTSHWNDPTAALGSITEPQKLLKDSPPRLLAKGRIEMGGEGPSAEIRRDLAHMIGKGHVTGVSIRWDDVPGKAIRRVNLPSDHPYFVDAETEKDRRKRYGVFFEEWRAMEGSVVALGADPKALIGRADETEGEVSSFWRGMAEDATCHRCTNKDELDEREILDPHSQGFVDAMNARERELAQALADKTDREFMEGAESDPEADAAAALSVLRMQVNDCRDAGVDAREMCEAFVGSLAEKEAESIRVVFRAADTAEPSEDDHAQLAAIVADAESSARAIAIFRAERVDLRRQLDAAQARVAELEAGDEAEEPDPLEGLPEELREPYRQRLEASEARATAAEAALEEERVRDDSAPSIAQERVDTGDPLQPIVTRPRELISFLHEELGKASTRVNAKFRAEVRKARGRIDNG